LALPHLYTIQGIDKLHLFLGHLRLQDEIEDLLLIEMSYMQLMTGIGPLFLNQDPAKFHWIDRGWMTSLWEFLNTANLTTSWTPKLQQEHDVFLMEYFLS